jgi:hypothetical protein
MASLLVLFFNVWAFWGLKLAPVLLSGFFVICLSANYT